MAQQVPSSSSVDYGVSLDKRLADLDMVDNKIFDILETTKEIISNLEKDKQISKSKMDESVKKFTRTLEDDIYKVVNEQLNYMEQLCVGAEHQGSMFRSQNLIEMSRGKLSHLHRELEEVFPSNEVEKKQPPAEPNLSDDDSSMEDVVSTTSD